ncbi:MAG: hypothetical protein EAZ95_12935 [Bacteroidetes bacterium]|nr:MAG: hypothetical protein EAZ95_12935 [Bacteroidota bacterium]
MSTLTEELCEYEIYEAQKRLEYQQVYDAKAKQEDFTTLAQFVEAFVKQCQTTLRIEVCQEQEAEETHWNCGAYTVLSVKLHNRKKENQIGIGTILEKENNIVVRTFWVNLSFDRGKKENFERCQNGGFHEIVEAFKDYILLNNLSKESKKYTSVWGKAVLIGSSTVLGKKMIVHPLLFTQYDETTDDGSWSGARYWTEVANMPLKIKLRATPLEILKTEETKLKNLMGRNEWSVSPAITLYDQQLKIIRDVIHFLSMDEDRQKFRIREEYKQKHKRRYNLI